MKDVKVPGVLGLHGLSDARGDVVQRQGGGQVAGEVVGLCEEKQTVKKGENLPEPQEIRSDFTAQREIKFCSARLCALTLSGEDELIS